MKCDKCGYNWSESGDSAHVCFAAPLDVMLRNAILRSAKVVEPKREWVGLTEDEIDYQAKKDDHAVYFALGALWAEAKLKEKNT